MLILMMMLMIVRHDTDVKYHDAVSCDEHMYDVHVCCEGNLQYLHLSVIQHH